MATAFDIRPAERPAGRPGLAAVRRSDAARFSFAADCIAGLSQARKAIPCKWLYDDAGSQLFERITALDEYYPSRIEEALLAQAAQDIAGAAEPKSLVELGSGASRKTRLLLAAADGIETYVPIDISNDELGRAQRSLRADFPRLEIRPLCADFSTPASLDLSGLPGPALLFFPGSTLGNMAPNQAIGFLDGLRGQMRPDTKLLLGVDLLKGESVLRAAYDDSAGITAAFNLNLLSRMKRELGAAVDVSGFSHRAVWNAADSRIEMHLEARSRQEIVLLGRCFTIDAGETIHTENSYKLAAAQWETIFEAAGWRIEHDWQSADPSFRIALLAMDAGATHGQ